MAACGEPIQLVLTLVFQGLTSGDHLAIQSSSQPEQQLQTRQCDLMTDCPTQFVSYNTVTAHNVSYLRYVSVPRMRALDIADAIVAMPNPPSALDSKLQAGGIAYC